MAIISSSATSPPATADGRALWRGWLLVAILMLLYAVAYLDRQIMALMVDQIRADLQITDSQIGLLQGIGFALFYALFGLPLGWLVDRAPRRWIIFAGISIWSLCAAGGAFARSFPQLFLARMGIGAGEAALSPAAFSMIADTMPRHRVTTALGAYAGGAGIGAALSVGLGGFLVAYAVAHAPIAVPVLGELKSWQFVFLVTGLPGVALGLLIFTVPEPARARSSQGERLPLRPFLKRHNRFLACHYLGFAMVQIIAYATASWTPAYMMRVFHWRITDIGIVLAVQALAAVLSAIAMGWLVDRWFQAGRTDAHLRFYAIATPVATLLLGIAYLMPNAVAFLTLYTLAVALLPMIGVASAGLQIATPGPLRGQVSALFLLVINIVGIGLGPALPGIFADHLFGSPQMIGRAVFVTALLVTPIAMISFALGFGAMRRAIAENAPDPAGGIRASGRPIFPIASAALK